MQEAAHRLTSEGDTGRAACYQAVATILERDTPQAFRLGKQVGLGEYQTPGLLPLSQVEQGRVRALVTEQEGFLRSWLLLPGPLQGPNQPSPPVRLDLYALSLYAAYQEGLASGLLEAASRQKGVVLTMSAPLWRWVNRPGVPLAICKDCVDRAARSRRQPYSLVELINIGFPAGGKTRCGSRCRCFVQLVGDDFILAGRSLRPAHSTAFHGVVDPATLKATHGNTVGKGTGK